MYKRKQGWAKHLDFFIIDEISLQLAFIVSVVIRHSRWAYAIPLYRSMGMIFVLVDALVLVMRDSMHNVLSRGYYLEFTETIKHSFFVFSIAAIYMFATQTGDAYSRIILFLTLVLHVLFGYGTRLLWKKLIRRLGKGSENKSSMLVIASPESAEEILKRLSASEQADYRIAGVVLTSGSDRKQVAGYPVVADMSGAADYIAREWIDSVYFDAPMSDAGTVELMDACSLMAVPTHYHVPEMSRNGVKRFSEKIGGTTVLTTSINYATPLQVFLKRSFDVAAGILGSIAAIILMAVVGPFIKRESPGPVLFRQERIGKNGKRFTMYKLRSMHLDAEERKKELLQQNRIKDGMMFKLDFDPRVIGNKVLPDGTKKTGIGEFIRRTSLDEYPQFFNVLKGDMSLVGTRPPTLDEWERYELHHRARLAVRPGITGLWQVSGRSAITDFEEVVRLDTEYITNWSPGMDLRILFKTIRVLVSRKGAL